MPFFERLNWNSNFECSDDLYVWYQMKAYMCVNFKAKHTWKQSIEAYKNHVFLQTRCTFSVRTALISWGHFIFSSWWLTILIATVHTFKWMKNLKTIIGCWVIATRCYLKKGLEKGLQNKTKKELEMFVVSYPNISPSFILILNRMERKQ